MTILKIARKGEIYVVTRAMLLALIVMAWSYQPISAQSPVNPADVEAVLGTNSRARVMVVLQAPPGGVEVRLQRQEIAQAQSEILGTVSTEDFRLIHRYETLPGLVGEVTEAGLNTLRNQPEVKAVALDLPVESILTENSALINTNDVWRDFGLTGAGVNVALLDSGIDLSHPDLTHSIVAQHCFNQNGCPPDSTNEGDNAQDENGHGTHVAGIIAGQGETSPRGIAPEAGIVAVRVLGNSGGGFTSDVLAGIDWVVANQTTLNVKVMNLSLGGGSYNGGCDQADANTILYADAAEMARQAGITIFAASGNNGKQEEMLAPACISSILSVGNVYDTPLSGLNWLNCIDEPVLADQVVCSSNSSSTLDLLAPGVLVSSTKLGGGRTSKSGTSMSTAYASAVAALILQANPNLTVSEVETLLKETGVPVTDARNGRVTPRIDALAAITRVTGTEITTLSGTVLLQGRTDHSGTAIFLSKEACSMAKADTPAIITGTDGTFEILIPDGQNYQCLQVVQLGYLTGQYSSPEGELGVMTLLGGDVTGDNIIDIFDLVPFQDDFDITG